MKSLTKREQWIVSNIVGLANDKLNNFESIEEKKEFLNKLIKLHRAETPNDVNQIVQRKPGYENLTVKEFVEHPDFLGMKGEVYPEIWPHIIAINDSSYDEAVLTGAIGTGKTTIALITQAWQLFILSRYKNPQLLYGLAKSSEIVFIFQNISATLAKEVDYERFRSMIDASPYFVSEFPYSTDVKSKLIFPNRIAIKPVSGQSTAAIGQNVFSGMIDEVNYMEVVEKSKRSYDGTDFDQAQALYNSIARRRKSRFMKFGRMPGVLCLVSSRKYPGQFTDRKEAEAKDEIEKTGSTRIYVYDPKPWEVLPTDRFSGDMFKIFVGNDHRRPRILLDDEAVKGPDKNLVMDIPIEYRYDFESDIMNAIREVAGLSTISISPFLVERELVSRAFKKEHKSILTDTSTDFKDRKFKIRRTFKHTEYDRWVHVDLGQSSDSAGVACGCVPKFTTIQRGSEVEIMPIIYFDFILEVMPPRGGEILFFKIRELLYKLRDMGLPIKWVSFDSFQSVDMIQILGHRGFSTGNVSIDKTSDAYDTTKTALYDGRVHAPIHPLAEKELISLERDEKKGKIDHPPKGSKDCADAIAGVIHSLTRRRVIWHQHDIDPVHIPQRVKQMIVQGDKEIKYVGEGHG